MLVSYLHLLNLLELLIHRLNNYAKVVVDYYVAKYLISLDISMIFPQFYILHAILLP